MSSSTLKYQISLFWYDYIIFSVMLISSILIAIYFGCFKHKTNNLSEHLIGNRQLKVLPTGISLIASHVSGITLLGVPSEIYFFGSTYGLIILSHIIIAIITITIYLPVFYNLKIFSLYEYLEKRFDNKIRLLASFLYTILAILHIPLVIYIPIMALSSAIEINLTVSILIVCSICIFYTTIGGLKSVIWSDTLQFCITLASVIIVLGLGINSVGGFKEIWTTAKNGDRLDVFNFDLKITEKNTFWSVLIGLTVHWLSIYTTTHSAVQKMIAVPNLKSAKIVVLIYAFGLIITSTICVLTGLVIYTKYSKCDPFTIKLINRNDQLLPYFVLDIGKNIPGLSGLFFAGIFSTALSAFSAHLQCLASTIYQDFFTKFFISKNMKENQKRNVLKLITFFTGIICMGIVFIFDKLGGVLPLSIALTALPAGVMLGIFTLGIFSRGANSKGVFYGGIFGLIAISCLILPKEYYQSVGLLKSVKKSLEIEGCYNFELDLNFLKGNKTINMEEKNVSAIFKISPYYYTLIGCLITIITSLIFSKFMGKNKKNLNEAVFCTFIQKNEKKNCEEMDISLLGKNSC